MMSDLNSEADTTSGIAGNVARWLTIVSAVVTLTLTVLNAYWSYQIKELDNNLKQREESLKEKQHDLEIVKENIVRYTFVHTLFDGVLNQNPSQRTLTINLISLALKEEEAKQLFSGLEVSGNQQIREVGVLGNELVSRNTIYLHLGKHDGSGVETLDPIDKALTSSGFRIAGHDNQKDQYGPGVDYFFAADKAGAEKVADILNKLRGPNEKRFVTRFQSVKNNEGVLGVWF